MQQLPVPLVLRPREAAQMLGVCQRTLSRWTQRGLIPHIRRGHIVLYPVDALREWLRESAYRTVRDNSPTRTR